MLIQKKRIPFKDIILLGFLPSVLKKAIYRLKGYKIGKNVSIGPGSVIIGEDVVIEDNVSIGFISVVRARHLRLRRHVRIGSMCFLDTVKIEIGEDTRINENVIVGGIKYPDSELIIGERVIVMEYSYLNPSRPLHIGDDTGIGGHSFLFTHGSWLSELEGYPVTFAPITLGKSVWLPWRVFIMPGVTIGDGSVIGANSLVTKSVPPHSLCAGSPAKVLKENYPAPLDHEQQRVLLEKYLAEFKDHLESHGIAVTVDRHQDGQLIFESVKGSQTNRMLVISDTREASAAEAFDTLVVLSEEESAVTAAAAGQMKIDLLRKTRTGSTDLGEEFVAFISRYGIRCKRLD